MPSEAEEFLGLKPDGGDSSGAEPEVPFRARLLTLAVTWLVALVISCPDPKGIMLLPFFPVGIFYFAQPLEVLWIPFWGVYVFLCVAILMAQTRAKFRVYQLILTVLLLLNVVGCHGLFAKLP